MLLIVAKEDRYINNLLEKINNTKETVKNINIYNCTYMDHNFLIATTNYGKVNVSSALSYIINKYKISVITYIGTCQSINNNLDILSAVIYKGSVQYDIDYCPLGIKSGMLPYMKNEEFLTNHDLNECMREICKKYNINYNTNLIASADMFVSNNNLARSIKTCYNASSIDDCSGTIGQIAYLNNIPYVGICIVSSYANFNAVKLYNTYEEEAISMCQKIAYKFINEYYS